MSSLTVDHWPTYIHVYKNNYAVTSSSSEKPQIKSGLLGDSFVATFTGNKYAAMAHIDDTTDINSLENIFSMFAQYKVPPKQTKVAIVGGWNTDQSHSLGDKILKKINQAGYTKITELMYSKEKILDQSGPGNDLRKHFFRGVAVDAISQQTFIFSAGVHTKDENGTVATMWDREQTTIPRHEGSLSQVYSSL